MADAGDTQEEQEPCGEQQAAEEEQVAVAPEAEQPMAGYPEDTEHSPGGKPAHVKWGRTADFPHRSRCPLPLPSTISYT